MLYLAVAAFLTAAKIQLALRNLRNCVHSRPTVCVTGAEAGVDSAWEQDAKRLEARKMLDAKRAAESPGSSARFVRRHWNLRQDDLSKDLLLLFCQPEFV